MVANVKILDVCSNRVCAVRVSLDRCHLLLVCVYMPHEGDDSMTDEFVNQLSVTESIIESNLDCHLIIGGDFNVDLARKWCHIELLTSFCVNNGLQSAVNHASSNVDYTYHFGMCRFSTIDHFLISGTLYEKAAKRIGVLHEVDNTPHHDPLVLRLCLQMSFVSCASKIHTPRVTPRSDFRPEVEFDHSSPDDLLTIRKHYS